MDGSASASGGGVRRVGYRGGGFHGREVWLVGRVVEFDGGWVREWMGRGVDVNGGNEGMAYCIGLAPIAGGGLRRGVGSGEDEGPDVKVGEVGGGTGTVDGSGGGGGGRGEMVAKAETKAGGGEVGGEDGGRDGAGEGEEGEKD